MQKVRRLYRSTAFFLGFPVLFQLSFNFPSQYFFTIGISILWFREGGAPSSKWLLLGGGRPTVSPPRPYLFLGEGGTPQGPPPGPPGNPSDFPKCSIYGTV